MKSKLPLIIRDSVHGDIELWEQIAVNLINSQEFQRLRRINQLGGGQFIFPSASHTRFTHCIGVYHLISEILKTKSFQENYPNPRQQLLVKLAGLLHDIGHGPFSHTFEMVNYVNKANISHEEYSALIIKSPITQVNQILKQELTDEEIAELCLMIEGKHPDKVLSSLVSSQIDADRMDYLLRDGKNSGVEYSHLDVQWIIRHIDIKDHKIVFPQKTQYAIESYLIGRYHMYKQIYLHPLSIGFDLTFKMFFQRLYDLYHAGFQFKNNDIIDLLKPLLEGKQMTAIAYCQLDDYTFFTYIKMLSNEEDEILQKLITMLTNRNFLRQIDAKRTDLEEIKKNLAKKYKNYYNYFMVEFELKQVKLYDGEKKPIFIQVNTDIKNLNEISEIFLANSDKKLHGSISYYTVNDVLK
ncbi:hypothetical protein P344_01340 [Spiroplasma mirum ATCC 29335]|uniref:HD domain-containing protein n=1 Tax=Spiroplasma mirum ATCC 29335 TaxID=838561 RepID=W0GNN8_9MOLU|nr:MULTISPECIES: HD domain-containing protein [Spiroplasma]AHF60673.1 hypothetical protein SMM_0216 [Spiroplasma mirum ATCC 29335]AHI57633.1 hypothetical protein P344_01340 [Spiroplasma mirum ATCC 29335]AKM52808.1 HD superfamily phosphohydrolase [Spiroplasma atrichopogonis]